MPPPPLKSGTGLIGHITGTTGEGWQGIRASLMAISRNESHERTRLVEVFEFRVSAAAKADSDDDRSSFYFTLSSVARDTVRQRTVYLDNSEIDDDFRSISAEQKLFADSRVFP